MSNNNPQQPPVPKAGIANFASRVPASNGFQQHAIATTTAANAPSAVGLVQGQPGAKPENPGVLYDLSSFDPLQAHALQLTASAGLTNLLAHQPTIAGTGRTGEPATTAAVHGQPPQQTQAVLQTVGTAPVGAIPPGPHGGPAPTALPPQPAYYYLQPPGGAPGTLQPIAPSPRQAVAALTSQTAPPGSFLVPAATPGGALAAVPATYQQQILPNTISTAVGAPGVLPSILMGQHLQTVVAPHHPTPLAPAIAPAIKRDRDEQVSTDQHKTKKHRELAPSVVSSSTHSTSQSGGLHTGFGGQIDKPPQEASQKDLDRMTPAERRRYERNLREQQRSYKISQQIKELRDVLAGSNVPFKPNKYSILLSVVEYIKQLQGRAIMLDAEHKKLITTIRQTKEMTNSGSTPSSADETTGSNQGGRGPNGSMSDMLFVQGLDYRSVFAQCPAALGIAALDGRILECNPEFQLLLGFPRDELLKQSLFNLVPNHQDIFRAMAEMLKGAEASANGGEAASAIAKNRFWSGAIISKRESKLLMNLTLTLGDNGSPKFFNCALTTGA